MDRKLRARLESELKIVYNQLVLVRESLQRGERAWPLTRLVEAENDLLRTWKTTLKEY